MFQSRRSARLAPAFFAVEPRQFDLQLQPPRSKLAEPAVVLQLFLKRGDLLRPHVPGVPFAQVAVAELTVLAAAVALLGGKASRVHAPEPCEAQLDRGNLRFELCLATAHDCIICLLYTSPSPRD